MEALTHTKRSTFKECRYRFYLRHELGLELISQKPGRRRGSAFGSAVFSVGSAVKAGLLDDSDITQWTTSTDIVRVIDSSLQSSYTDLLEGAQSTEQVWDLQLEMTKLAVIVLEYVCKYNVQERREVTFDLPLVNPTSGRPSRSFTRAGKVDGMIPTGENTAIIVEDKLYQSIDASLVESLPLDEQVFEYVDALASKGWRAQVEYRITRYPGINPAKAKEFKTKANQPAETLEQFYTRLRADVKERPEFYFVCERLIFDEEMLVRYRQERWDTAKDILEARNSNRFYRSTSRCKDFGGCIFLPHCRGHDPNLDMYRTVVDNIELLPAGEEPGEV